jgi:outer membrane protein assembly factor BamB
MLAIMVASSASSAVAADGWTQFRGSRGDGIAQTDVTEWSVDKNIAWKVTIPGAGWSQPITWGDRIFVTAAETDRGGKPERGDWAAALASGRASPEGTAEPNSDSRSDAKTADSGKPPERPRYRFRDFIFGGNLGLDPPDAVYRWKLYCLDANTGGIIWERTAHEGKPSMPIHRSNTYASESPVTDGERVIAYFGMTGIYCYDLSGTLLWSKPLETYPTQMGWGTGSSPVLYGHSVIVQCDNDKSSFLMALDKTTGSEIWRVARDEGSNWSTPYVWKNKQRTELVTAGGAKMRSYDPNTGELLWQMKGSGRTATSPVGDSEFVYVDSVDRLMGRAGILAAVRAGANGDISLKKGETSNEHVAWSVRLNGNRVASPLLYAGHLYLLEQPSGIIHCLDAHTGKQLFRKRLPGASGFTASPWASQGKVFCLDQDGLTLVIEPGPQLRVISSNDLGDEMFWSSAAAAGDRLLLRSVDHLFCVKRGAGLQPATEPDG